MQAQHAQPLGQLLYEIEGIHSHYLPGGPRWIRQWTKQIEHGAHAQLAAHGLYLLHSGV
jgi:hypothetical protein